MFCKYCGHKLEDGANFCKRCGAKIHISKKKLQKNKKPNGRGIVLIFIIAVLVVAAAGILLTCNRNAEDPDALKEAAVSVSFERFYKEDTLTEYAILTGKDPMGNVIWTYRSDEYPGTELDAINEIGIYNNVYYFVESGSVRTLRLSDGSTIWSNPDFGGSASGYVFDEIGNLYLCGYYGPDFFAVDKAGKTIKCIERLDEKYDWPYEMECTEGQVRITFSGCPDGKEKAVFCVDLGDFSYYLQN